MKHIFIKTLFLILVFGYGTNLWGQQKGKLTFLSRDTVARLYNRNAEIFEPYQSNLSNLIMPYPTSRQLQKYIGYPVSHSTGMVDVSVPLFRLAFHNYILPFTLSYHSSGVRIQDEAGLVGLGWTLRPGYKISRIVMGKPDDLYPVKNISQLLGNPTLEQKINAATPASSFDTQYTGMAGDTDRNDAQYDIFSIHLPDIDANFILQDTSNGYTASLIDTQPLLIEPISYNSISTGKVLLGFKVTDDKGTVYYFGEESYHSPGTSQYNMYSERVPDNGGNMSYNAGWMVRQITLPSGDIRFSYTDHSESASFTPQYANVIDNGNSLPLAPLGDLTDYQVITGREDYSILTGEAPVPARNNVKLLSSIDCDAFTCTFNYTAGSDNKRLTSITATNKSTVIKNVTFYHENDSRFLSRLYVSGEGYYHFDYNRLTNDMNQKAIDWWGFFNNRTSNISTIPATTLSITLGAANNGRTFTMSMPNGANREPDVTAMKAKSLERITYPTGGTFTIEYEPHKYTYQNVERNGAGLRVKSTRLYDVTSGKTIIKSYIYEEPHYTEELYPDASYNMTETQLCMALKKQASPSVSGYSQIAGYNTARSRYYRTFSPILDLNPAPVWYGKVTENTAEGKTVYTYTHTADVNNNWVTTGNWELAGVYPGVIYRYVYSKPNLLTQTVYNSTGSEVKKRTYTYGNSTNFLTGIFIVPYRHLLSGGEDDIISDCNSNFLRMCEYETYADKFGDPLALRTYKLCTGCNFLLSETTENVTPQGRVVRTSAYTYDSSKPFLLRSKNVTDSRSGTYQETYYYPHDGSSLPGYSSLAAAEKNILSSMLTDNRQTTVVEQLLKRSGIPVYGKLFGYGKTGMNNYAPVQVYFKKGDSGYISRLTYQYDGIGNTCAAIKDKVEKIVYLWSYKNQYPVAKIEGMTYSEVTSLLGSATITGLANSTVPSETILQNLRSKLASALVTTYTYVPQVGILTEIRPNGEKIIYTYDSQQRLQSIKEHAGKTMESYEYHYKQ